MRNLLPALTCLLFSLVIPLVAAPKDKRSEPAIVPVPNACSVQSGKFVFKPTTQIVAASPEAVGVARYFQKEIERATGMKLPIEKGGINNAVILRLKPSEKMHDEGYKLEVAGTRITILAKTPAGLFYGLQTVRQLMPPEIYRRKATKDKIEWSLPCVKIVDAPRFKWRGVHLDCGRHFYSKNELKKIIDALSWHKINRFHWHLTEDQGWRIEIKKYPKLTKIGAWRSNLLVNECPDAEPRGHYPLEKSDSPFWDAKGRYGGFYSQADVKEIVAYAAERFITIVPEIEIPGHSTAALLAYPEFSCDGRPPGGLPLKGGVFGKVYCPGKEETFKFLTGVLDEVTKLFPSEYIHIGGDECPKGAWKNCPDCQKRIKAEKLVAEGKRTAEDKLQSYTIARIQKFLEKKGRKIIAWDEITEGGIPKGCTVMHWREYTDAKIAPNEGENLIVATRPSCYYNWGYDKADRKFLFSQGGIMPMKQAYDFEPIPRGLPPKLEKHVLGAQACFWGEKAPNAQIVEFHFFPRMSAMSEATWSRKEDRNWADFQRRVEAQQARYKAAGINARPTRIPENYKPYKKYRKN